MISPSKKDQDLLRRVQDVIQSAIAEADMPSAVAKKIALRRQVIEIAEGTLLENGTPSTASVKHSEAPLAQEDAVLDELEPEQGYSGKVRWVCLKANNGGKRSCGVC